MEPTTIILIAVFIICGVMLIWAIKNGNNIKFKKKEKKSKDKKAKEDKFKDIVPKENPQKELKQKISDNAKAEKAGKQPMPTNKIVKVTKEDFKNNDLEVPKALEEPKGTAKEANQKKDDFKLDDFNIKPDPNLKLGGGLDDFKFSDDIFKNDAFKFDDPNMDDFLLPPLNDSLDSTNPFTTTQDDLFKFDDNSIPPLDFNSDPFGSPFKSNNSKPRESGKILSESMAERFNQVFGESLAESGGAKEIIIGDVLAGNRSRTNRELREKRLKKLR